MVRIFTDGACSNNPGPGGWGAVFYKDTEQEIISGHEVETTNNRMELMAIVKALSKIKREYKECRDYEIYSDSAYVVNSINQKWVYSWKKNNWVKSNKSKAKNIDLWERMLELISYHNVRFIKVKGHADNKYNNRCDVLAVEAREKLV